VNQDERKALSSLRFNSAPTADDVWRQLPFNVPELHRDVVDRVFEGVDLARRSADDSSPLGVVIQGPSGAGKTHMLGMVRERTQREGGYFFLISLLDGKAFWESAALALASGLLQQTADGPTQLTVFLDRLGALLGLSQEVRDVISGTSGTPTPAVLDEFISALRRRSRSLGQEARDTARALVLYGSADYAASDIGQGYLNSLDPDESSDGRSRWGIGRVSRTPQQIVHDVSRLLALTGPTVIAIDQIDILISQTNNSVLRADPWPGQGSGSAGAALLAQIADGLMALRENTNRALTVVACMPDTWVMIKRDAATSVPDRFRETSVIERIPNPAVGREVVRKRFEVCFDKAGFKPPYPTWPIAESAFADAGQFTARALIRQVEAHVLNCLRSGTVVELAKLDDGHKIGPLPPGGDTDRPTDDSALTALDGRFARYVREAEVAGALNAKTEDQILPGLLAAGLTAWITEISGDGAAYKLDPLPGARPALHARLRQILNEDTENELHWGLRGIASGNANAVLSRIRTACTLAALDPAIPARKLVLLRNGDWPHGPKTAEVVQSFHAAGGRTCTVAEDDLKVFAALGKLADEADEHLAAWLIARKPAGSTALLRDLLGVQTSQTVHTAQPARSAEPKVVDEPVDPEPESGSTPGPAAETELGPWSPDPLPPSSFSSTVPLGATIGASGGDGGQQLAIELEALRKHTVIFAGSGSGKTVLIRRLVEECALQGVSAIVLDPNNDLGRLGEPWPQPPSGWTPGDAVKADEYLANTEVVIWTPRISAGRPLTFQPLPNFAAVRDDPDELQAAIDVATSALAPRAKVNGNTPKADLGQAVLREALRYFAQHGGGGLRSFIDLLADLPEHATSLAPGPKTGAELAERLTAAMVNDPLFGGDGVPVDPGLLLTPTPGSRARISVISFVGLHSDEQRQGFVNQLQMALFAWIKRHPAGDRPLGGLFVMDEAQTFAPSGGKTACTESTLALASQARKYGLGLVFATQAPKGLHNRIPGNSATQFFGLLNSPAAIDAAKEMAQAKGGAVPDIGLLTTGQFYAAREGFAFQKMQAPLCLSHHPRSPLTAEELIERAAPGRGRRRRDYG
jgi:Helicase HerA, central domain